jgi:hypothetical protein
MHRLVFAAFALVVAVSAAGTPLPESERERLARAAFAHRRPAPAHSRRCESSCRYTGVSSRFDEPYHSAQLSGFPNAREHVNGGCEVDPKLLRAKTASLRLRELQAD